MRIEVQEQFDVIERRLGRIQILEEVAHALVGAIGRDDTLRIFASWFAVNMDAMRERDKYVHTH